MSSHLGLEHSEVLLAAPDSDWQEEFIRERRVLGEALGSLAIAIEHVGSTAVGTIPAKPIIDIAILVDSDTAISQAVSRLEAAGYIYRGNTDNQGGHLFVKESSPGVRTHHVHVAHKDDPQWRDWLRFRDFLRTDRELRRRYAQLKSELKERFPHDRQSYTLGKSRFIETALKR